MVCFRVVSLRSWPCILVAFSKPANHIQLIVDNTWSPTRITSASEQCSSWCCTCPSLIKFLSFIHKNQKPHTECLLHMENLKTVAPFVTNEFYEFYKPESMPTSARKQKVLYLPCIWHVGCSKGRPVSSNKVAYQNMIQSCRHCHCATVLPLQRAFHPPLQMRSCQQCVVHWVRGAAQTNDSIVDHTHATHWPLPDPREVRYIEG